MKGIALGSLAIAALACGGSSSNAPSSPYGGSYDTQVTLLSENCTPDPTVQNATTTVAQNGTSPSISLSHAGNTYPATVDGAGNFTALATQVAGATVDMTGQFNGNGFTATVNVQQNQPACTYSVRWVGTKTSSTYPGDPYGP